MSWLKYINPVNWIKQGVVAKVESEVDRIVERQFLASQSRMAINYLIGMSESKTDDAKVKLVVKNLKHIAELMEKVSDALDPEGDEGKRISEEELNAIILKAENFSINFVGDEALEKIRAWIKARVRTAMGMEG